MASIREEAFVNEIQTNADEDKRWSWPVHVAGLRARLRCPVTLVVITALVLQARGLAPSSTQREQLERCSEADRLEAWLRRAATASEVGQLFEP